MTGTPHPRAHPTPDAGKWWMLFVLFFFYFLSFIDRTVFTVLAVPLKESLQLSDTQISLAMGPAFMVCYAIFGIPLGWAADRLPRRWVIFTGTVVWSLATAATGLARSFAGVFVARAGVGAGEAALSPSAFSMLADRFPTNQLALALAIYQTAIYLGAGAAFALVAVILANVDQIEAAIPWLAGLESWRLTFLLLGLPGLLFALLIFTFTEPARKRTASPAAVDEGVGGELQNFLRQRAALLGLLAVGFGLVGLVAYAIQAWVPTYLQRQFHWQPQDFGPIVSIIYLINAMVLLGKGAIMDWMFKRGTRDAYVRLYLWLVVLSCPATIGIFLVNSPGLFIVLFGLMMVIVLPFQAYVMASVQIFTPPRLRGRITAGFIFAFSITGAIGPVIVGLITDNVFADEAMLGWSLAIVTTGFIPIAFGLLCLSLKPLREAVAENLGDETGEEQNGTS